MWPLTFRKILARPPTLDNLHKLVRMDVNKSVLRNNLNALAWHGSYQIWISHGNPCVVSFSPTSYWRPVSPMKGLITLTFLLEMQHSPVSVVTHYQDASAVKLCVRFCLINRTPSATPDL